jgi:hypothetical protein
MVFQQRNGRVDRYGQNHNPQLYYLITESSNKTVRGDMRILEILQQKDEQANLNIGDPATFMKVHDVEQEQQLTEQAMANGMSADDFDQTYQADESNEGDELLALFFSREEQAVTTQDDSPIAESWSIYASDYQFVKASFEFLNRNSGSPIADVSYHDDKQSLSLIAPDDLKDRFRYMPAEIWPENGEFFLTADVEAYKDECARSRNDEHAWPKQHYLWRKHPVIEWLQDRMLSNTGRHEALVLGLNSDIEPNQAIFLVSALIPNRKANPVIWSWYGVHCRHAEVIEISSLQQTLKVFNFGQKPRPNTAKPVDMDALNGLRQPVVNAIKQTILKEREIFEAQNRPKLEAQLSELKKLRSRQVEQLELALFSDKRIDQFKQNRRNTQMKHIEDVFTHYQRWVEDTLQTEPEPYIQIIAIIARAQD